MITTSNQLIFFNLYMFNLWRKLWERISSAKSYCHYSLLGLLLFLLVQLFLVSAAQATIKDTDKLDCVCSETAVRLAARLGERRLDNVAVYFFRPRGCNLKDMDDKTRIEAGIVTQTMEDVLTNRSEFKILNRNSEVWAAVLHDEGNRGTLDSHDILEVGTGFGADWIVTGEYWSENNGYFYLRTRLFDCKSGEALASTLVSSSFVSSQRRQLQRLFVGLMVFILLIAGGYALYFISKKRKSNYCKPPDIDRKSKNKTQQIGNSIMSKKLNFDPHTNFKINLKKRLAKSVNPKHYQIDPVNHNLTKPKTWGIFVVSDESVPKIEKKFRLGNYPVRQRELEKEFELVKLIALFEKRDDADDLLDLLNKNQPNLKELFMARAVDPKNYAIDQANPNWTKPRTWGTFMIYDKTTDNNEKKFRFGNYPVRMKELQREYGSVKLVALFEDRTDAGMLADWLKKKFQV